MGLTRYFTLRFAANPDANQLARNAAFETRARFQMWPDEMRVIGASGRAVELATRVAPIKRSCPSQVALWRFRGKVRSFRLLPYPRLHEKTTQFRRKLSQ
jgi:hypothetical protein